jgi:hypothetical protein
MINKILLTVGFNQGHLSSMHITNDTNIVPTSDSMSYLSSSAPQIPGEENYLVVKSEKLNGRSGIVTQEISHSREGNIHLLKPRLHMLSLVTIS